jgi:kynureninase
MLSAAFNPSLEFAQTLDANDPLQPFRHHFYLPGKTIYLNGNSLGLCPREGNASLLRVLNEWKTMGIGGWLTGDPPWFGMAEEIGKLMSPLVGARSGEVICTGTTTVNQHALLSTFYTPSRRKTKIVADEKNFPSDIYALKGHLKMRGYDPEKHLTLVPAEPDGTVSENRILDHLTEDVVLALFPSVYFRNGQLLDMASITEAAHKKEIIIGFDCSHSAGVVPHALSDMGVDFAYWCGYKYLNGGPGCPAFIYVNERHFEKEPMMAGWFGFQKERQFDMSLDFLHQRDAGGWQISTPAVLSMAPLKNALEIIHQATIEQIREKSLNLTTYLIALVDELLSGPPYDFFIGTPADPGKRGGHVALKRKADAWPITRSLKSRNIISDFRSPDTIRVAPSPLYSCYEDIWRMVEALQEIIDSRDYENQPETLNPVP